jgi:hypothetical protein
MVLGRIPEVTHASHKLNGQLHSKERTEGAWLLLGEISSLFGLIRGRRRLRLMLPSPEPNRGKRSVNICINEGTAVVHVPSTTVDRCDAVLVMRQAAKTMRRTVCLRLAY